MNTDFEQPCPKCPHCGTTKMHNQTPIDATKQFVFCIECETTYLIYGKTCPKCKEVYWTTYSDQTCPKCPVTVTLGETITTTKDPQEELEHYVCSMCNVPLYKRKGIQRTYCQTCESKIFEVKTHLAQKQSKPKQPTPPKQKIKLGQRKVRIHKDD